MDTRKLTTPLLKPWQSITGLPRLTRRWPTRPSGMTGTGQRRKENSKKLSNSIRITRQRISGSQLIWRLKAALRKRFKKVSANGYGICDCTRHFRGCGKNHPGEENAGGAHREFPEYLYFRLSHC